MQSLSGFDFEQLNSYQWIYNDNRWFLSLFLYSHQTLLMSYFLLETALHVFSNYLKPCFHPVGACFSVNLCPVSPLFILFWITQCRPYFYRVKKKFCSLTEFCSVHLCRSSWTVEWDLWECCVPVWWLVDYSFWPACSRLTSLHQDYQSEQLRLQSRFQPFPALKERVFCL